MADVIAAIQFMSTNERSSLPCEDWAEGISGNKAKSTHWQKVFDEHPEFFRRSPNYEGYYALIWRRASPRLFFRKEGRLLTQAEYNGLPDLDKTLVSRPPVPTQQIKTLIDLAVELHAKAREQHTDWRWWVPIVTSFLGSFIGVLSGLAFHK
ncbi:N-carbamoyl-L-amino acid amidohydrolase [Mesorhizobium sp. M2D.F.Ca.ET.223.01.1.1]|uniref:N-carbamoyl-L-amino acid amidohydrolase n=1 Tax=Mesorhizobium sp. M2D.F.Ca.ET.223.01.1.1 TaxID=2563940 RepID=UPI001092ADF5|nr:N-carbamoyl-L-amino acid amidohydrolase [Mesorhizobium sp. M2D.F.Ca.ET.223.01.1.1]TGR88746.1 N-carbamoyl-L-amino acid amidohydrolase [Mesorhizobium sp. M2D.F.Ca.ET.223.01.1.1]